MDLIKRAKEFIEERHDRSSPLLLGYSGGPDSKALLYALLDCGIDLHLAHVDHGWREESRCEAAQLRREAEELGLPFHTIRLESIPTKNVEGHARAMRLAFFKTLFGKIGFQALLLAHHCDDLAETALKRIFEGAHLPFLGGMATVAEIEGMAVWRPFLGVKKEAIWGYLDKNRLEPLIDRTNRDPKYLRNRLRHEIIPYLSEQFGKEVAGNLSLLGERAAELKEYLDGRVEAAWSGRRMAPWGFSVNTDGLERIEARHLLQKGVRFSRDLLEQCLDALLGKKKNIAFRMNGQTVVADQGWAQIKSDEKSITESAVARLGQE